MCHAPAHHSQYATVVRAFTMQRCSTAFIAILAVALSPLLLAPQTQTGRRVGPFISSTGASVPSWVASSRSIPSTGRVDWRVSPENGGKDHTKRNASTLLCKSILRLAPQGKPTKLHSISLFAVQTRQHSNFYRA